MLDLNSLVEQVLNYVANGIDPSKAVVKVAEENGLNKNYVDRLIEKTSGLISRRGITNFQ